MSKKLTKQIIVGLLTITLTCTPLLAVEQTITTNTYNTQVSRANVKIKEYPYQRVELTEVENLLQELDTIIEKKDIDAYYKWDEAYFELYCKVHTMSQLAYLRHQRFNNEEKYFDEYLYNVDLLGKMRTAYVERFEPEENKQSEVITRLYDLNIERTKLVDDYMLKEGTTKIEVNGREMTMQDLMKDTSLSAEQFYTLYDKWYTAYSQEVGQILLQLVKVDNEIATLQGYDAYIDYAYDSFYRDYSPNEAKQYIANVKELIPSLYTQLYKKNIAATALLINYTYPDEATLLKNIETGFISKYPQLKPAYDYMRQYNLYDIENRENKSSGAFTTYFNYLDQPFIFINYSLPYETALTLIHEFGHYYSYYEIGMNNGGLDLDETYSQAMELLAFDAYDNIFQDEKLAEAAQIYILSSLLGAVIQGCLYDEFLQAVYQNPNMTVQEMNNLYVQLAKHYGFEADGRSWSTIAHNFQSPFYYMSYSVSAVVALQIWLADLEEDKSGMEIYSKLIQAGKDEGFMHALSTAGLNNPLQKSTLQEITTTIQSYISK